MAKAGKSESEVDRAKRLKKLEGHLKDKLSSTISNLESKPYKIWKQSETQHKGINT